MSSGQSKTDASASALGYLYQCRYALCLALEEDDSGYSTISIEKLDDIAIEKDNPANNLSTEKWFQLKHHITRKGGTTNKCKDVWNTLKIWSEAASTGKINLETCRLCLVTTSIASSSHAISNLRPEYNDRDSEKARELLEEAGKSSKSNFIKDCYKSLKKLNVTQRKQMFSSTCLFDNSASVDQIQLKLEKSLWKAVDPKQVGAFVERLEGWRFSKVIDHLNSSSSDAISIEQIQGQIHFLREQFKRDNLPDDLLLEVVPESEKQSDDTRNFVTQLKIINVSSNRIRKAQENHYKAVAQRSKWIRNNLLDLEEWDNFELKLLSEWEEFYEIMVDDLDATKEEDKLIEAGDSLYKWAHKLSANSLSLFIRPLFRSAYLSRGSYHMLANQLRLGWHRDFKDRL